MLNYNRNMHQTATYWSPGNNDGFGGRDYGAPRTITVRWQDDAVLFRDPQGNELTSSSIVYPPERLEVHGYLYLGTSVDADPTTVDGAKEIRQAAQSPNMGGTLQINKVWL